MHARPMRSPQTPPLEDLGRGLHYRPVRSLGEGSHGVVLLVRHARLDKPFVMKLIQQKFLADSAIVGRFIAEAQRGARLSHDAFAPIIDLGETQDGRTYFVMEYVEGSTLLDVLRSRGALPLDEALVLGLQLLDGLAAAHDAHLIHRDIKPANVFITTRGRLKILDLGISKSILDSGTGPNTAKGVAIGTPRYMSPEQAFGMPVSFATDIYAVGLVLFEMLTAVPVFDAHDAHELIRCHVKEPAPSMFQRCGRTFPSAVEAIVARALSKKQSERFQTAREMQRALHAVLESLHALPPRPSTPPLVDDASNEALLEGDPTIRDANAGTIIPSSTPPVAALFAGVATTVEIPVRTELLPSPTQANASDTAGATTRTHDDAAGTTAPSTRKAWRPLLALAAVCGALGVALAIVAAFMLVVHGGAQTREGAVAGSTTKIETERTPMPPMPSSTPLPPKASANATAGFASASNTHSVASVGTPVMSTAFSVPPTPTTSVVPRKPITMKAPTPVAPDIEPSIVAAPVEPPVIAPATSSAAAMPSTESAIADRQ
jgi:serine/threonine protein kinase